MLRVRPIAGAPLARALSLPLITLYGLGTIIGAGIYVLIGKVAGHAGIFAPIAFLVAATIAGFTAFSYAELAARFPQSSGEAIYVLRAFNRRGLATATGFAVVATGVVSAATIANGFTGYLGVFFSIPDWVGIVAFIATLGLIAGWGISESVWFATLVTALSLIGLIIVIAVAGQDLRDVPARVDELVPPLSLGAWTGILLGAFIAFYAFIGFEDMVNVAEEVRNPQRNLPIGILVALFIATLLYVSVALVAVLSLPIDQLAASDAPLVEIVQGSGYRSSEIIAVLSLLSVTNSALAQIIMASRILYGLARQNAIPAAFGNVNPRTRTPLLATAVIALSVLVLALWLPLVTLAEMTSFVVISIFALVNAALVWIKHRRIPADGVVQYPVWVPAIGTLLCLSFLTFEVATKIGH